MDNIRNLIERRDRLRRNFSDKICGTFAFILGAAVVVASVVLLPFGPETRVPLAFFFVVVVLAAMYWVRHLFHAHNDLQQVNDQIWFSNQIASQSTTIETLYVH